MAERLSISEYSSGTAYAVGVGVEIFTLKEYSTGLSTITGASFETIAFLEGGVATVLVGGTSRESIKFIDSSVGALLISGLSAEYGKLSEFSIGSLGPIVGTTVELFYFSEHSRSDIIGKAAESIFFTSSENGIVVDSESGEVWVLNLVTGGHSRYLGKIDGTSVVDSYALTPKSYLGSNNKKLLPSVYLSIRTAEGVQLSVIYDEQKERTGFELVPDGKEGLHERRIKLPQGIHFSNVQFKIQNIEGSKFLIKELRAQPEPTSRV